MHECKGDAEITLKIRFKNVVGQFNSNYKGGIQFLEDEAMEQFSSFLPNGIEIVDVIDVTILNYEHKTAEREVENED